MVGRLHFKNIHSNLARSAKSQWVNEIRSALVRYASGALYVWDPPATFVKKVTARL